MSRTEQTFLESWPALKDDLKDFLADTDAWIISALKEAHSSKDWGKVLKIIDIMETVHNMSHSH